MSLALQPVAPYAAASLVDTAATFPSPSHFVMREFIECLEAFQIQNISLRVPASRVVLRPQQSGWSECVYSGDRMEERQSPYLPHCVMASPSRQVPGDLDVKEEEARPAKKRTFADLDGEHVVDSRADSLVGFSAQPASGNTGERHSHVGPGLPRAALRH